LPRHPAGEYCFCVAAPRRKHKPKRVAKIKWLASLCPTNVINSTAATRGPRIRGAGCQLHRGRGDSVPQQAALQQKSNSRMGWHVGSNLVYADEDELAREKKLRNGQTSRASRRSLPNTAVSITSDAIVRWRARVCCYWGGWSDEYWEKVARHDGSDARIGSLLFVAGRERLGKRGGHQTNRAVRTT
jgi:hypothetical protein